MANNFWLWQKKPNVMKQFVFFVLCSGFAATVNFSSRIIYNQWLNFSWSVVAAFITGLITAFVLNKLFVFKESQQSVHRSAFFFLLVNLFALLQTWAISMGLAYYVLPYWNITQAIYDIFSLVELTSPKLDDIQVNKAVAHAIGVIAPVFTSYLAHKRWSFR